MRFTRLLEVGRVIPGRLRSKAALEVVRIVINSLETPSAVHRLGELVSGKQNVLGVRLGVKKRGCSGLSYTLDYATEKKATDEIVEANGIKVFIDPQALFSVVGTKMDFIEDDLKSEFVFINPNAKSLCGCGESFNVE